MPLAYKKPQGMTDGDEVFAALKAMCGIGVGVA